MPPYWQRLPEAFAFPFSLPALWRILPFTAVAALVGAHPEIWSFSVGLLVVSAMLLVFWFGSYGYWVLWKAADGYSANEDKHNLDDTMLLIGDAPIPRTLPIKQAIIIGLGLLFIDTAEDWGTIPGLIATWLVTLLVPAGIMILGYTHSFRQAANPARLFDLLRSLGLGYLIIFGLSYVFFRNNARLADEISGLFPEAIAIPLMVHATLHYCLAYMMFLGMAMHDASSDLGYLPDHERRKQHDIASAPLEPEVMDRIELARELYERGQPDSALTALHEELRRRPDQLEAHRLYHRITLNTGKTLEHALHAPRYADTLWQLERYDELLDLLRTVGNPVVRKRLAPRSTETARNFMAAAKRKGEAKVGEEMLGYWKRSAAQDTHQA